MSQLGNDLKEWVSGLLLAPIAYMSMNLNGRVNRLEARGEDITDRLDRIESKLDRALERKSEE